MLTRRQVKTPLKHDSDKALSGEEAAGGAALGTRVKDTEGATQAQANNGAVAPEATAQECSCAQQAAAAQLSSTHRASSTC